MQDDFALAAGQDAEGRVQPRIEEQVELVARDDCRDRRPNVVQAGKLMSGAACRHDDGRRSVSRRRVRGRTGDDGLPERLKVRDADQPRPAGRNQGACGRRSCVRISVRARAPSISAPAAADDASHARSTLLASVASRRIRAAFSAMWTALTNTAWARGQFLGRRNHGGPLENPRDQAIEPRQRGRRRAGERLDVLERRAKRGEDVERPADRGAIAGEFRRPEIPPVTSETQPSRRVELLLDHLHERIDGVRALLAEQRVAPGDPGEQALHAEHVARSVRDNPPRS